MFLIILNSLNIVTISYPIYKLHITDYYSRFSLNNRK